MTEVDPTTVVSGADDVVVSDEMELSVPAALFVDED